MGFEKIVLVGWIKYGILEERFTFFVPHDTVSRIVISF